eukprot:TRINITY_DN3567_c0_g2_i1.p1 TRINITY_DN3567_c0_g2~~TRINITY_DN3567_c0_g2_i1.p1  ORF type:complete len:160 (-),score=27.65 TRINITY_DN3567_c0_g2_i1:125-604(-)
MIENKSDLNILCNGDTSFHLSAKANKTVQIFQLLIENSSQLNMTNFKKMSPLHYLCINNQNNIELIDFLVSKIDKKFLNLKSKANLTPLQYACINKNLDTIKLLIEKGSSIANDKNPLYIACDKNRETEIIEFLVEKKCSFLINEKGEYSTSSSLLEKK